MKRTRRYKDGAIQHLNTLLPNNGTKDNQFLFSSPLNRKGNWIHILWWFFILFYFFSSVSCLSSLRFYSSAYIFWIYSTCLKLFSIRAENFEEIYVTLVTSTCMEINFPNAKQSHSVQIFLLQTHLINLAVWCSFHCNTIECYSSPGHYQWELSFWIVSMAIMLNRKAFKSFFFIMRYIIIIPRIFNSIEADVWSTW